jgi:16S rRNA (cytosine967-C5)-methyltransferase
LFRNTVQAFAQRPLQIHPIAMTLKVEISAKRTAMALWQQLLAASGVIKAVQDGTSTTVSLGQVKPELRPGVQALVFRTLRSLGRAQALRRLLVDRNPPPLADALLCTALALAWRDADAPYEPFTLVNQAVEAAKRSVDMKRQASFINACLRRFLRERDGLVKATDANPIARWNHPQWWIDRLKQDHPSHWQSILEANNQQAPMILRVNARQFSRDDYLKALAQVSIAATPAGVPTVACSQTHGIVLRDAHPVSDLPGFATGAVSVQDAAAQLAAPLLLDGLGLNDGLRVLDACAAPGGKTLHLLEMSNAEVTALDIDPLRCERIQGALQRLGLTAKVLVGDASEPQTWWDGKPFDAILLDAPCTASGIVRRHPDVPWLRRPGDVAQLAAIQRQLLAVLWPLLKPGGRLLYCTCSVFKAEGEAQIQTFLAHNTHATLLPSPGHLMPHFGVNADAVPDNLSDDHDGFYFALLQKHPA